MALYWLMNNVLFGANQLYAGTQLNDAIDNTTGIQAAGGRLVAVGASSSIDDAAAAALIARQRGGSPAEMESIMNAASDAVDASDISTVSSDLASTATGKGASLVGVEDAGGILDGATVEAVLAELKIIKKSATLDFTADGFGALGGGVKTFEKAIATTPANARLVGWSVGETFTGFDDATHGTYALEIGENGADVDEIMTSESVAAGVTAVPLAGTAGILGFNMAPIGGKDVQMKLTSSVDLNTVTAGSLDVNLFYVVLP